MGEKIYDAAFQSWLNEQTCHVLEEVVSDLGFDQETTFSLCTVLYFESSWSLPFDKDKTYIDTFYSTNGERDATFMRKEEGGASVYLGEGFSPVIMDMQDGDYAVFVLPDSEKGIGEILQSEELFNFIFSGTEWPITKRGKVTISIPQVDILAGTSLVDLFARLGVTDIFNPEKANFSNDIISDNAMKLAAADQYSRFIMNEDGVESASILVSGPTTFQIPGSDSILSAF